MHLPSTDHNQPRHRGAKAQSLEVRFDTEFRLMSFSSAGTTKAEHFAHAYLALACQALKWQHYFEGARSHCINARGDVVAFSRAESEEPSQAPGCRITSRC